MFFIYNKLLKIILENIVPATKISISKGNKIFGAAILNKTDLFKIAIGTNNETVNPLFHGEISAINEYYQINELTKLKPQDCIFLSTHEPCSMCLSAITWSGFDNFYYFFPYEDTKNKFNIPHDLNILSNIFNINNGNYNHSNDYWESHSILKEIEILSNKDKKILNKKIDEILNKYNYLSELYQLSKLENKIPLN